LESITTAQTYLFSTELCTAIKYALGDDSGVFPKKMSLLVKDCKSRTSRGLLTQSLSGLTRASEPSSSHLRKVSCFLLFLGEIISQSSFLYPLTWSSLSTLVKLASIMNETLTHRSFSTNTPLRSGRFCYHLFRAEQRRTQRRRAS
jgi:hypothetical protein